MAWTANVLLAPAIRRNQVELPSPAQISGKSVAHLALQSQIDYTAGPTSFRT